MSLARLAILHIAIFGLIVLSGCQSTGGSSRFLDFGAFDSQGTLKARLSQVQSDRDELRRQLLQTRSDNDRLRSQLIASEEQNEYLADRINYGSAPLRDDATRISSERPPQRPGLIGNSQVGEIREIPPRVQINSDAGRRESSSPWTVPDDARERPLFRVQDGDVGLRLDRSDLPPTRISWKPRKLGALTQTTR